MTMEIMNKFLAMMMPNVIGMPTYLLINYYINIIWKKFYFFWRIMMELLRWMFSQRINHLQHFWDIFLGFFWTDIEIMNGWAIMPIKPAICKTGGQWAIIASQHVVWVIDDWSIYIYIFLFLWLDYCLLTADDVEPTNRSKPNVYFNWKKKRKYTNNSCFVSVQIRISKNRLLSHFIGDCT